MFSLDDLCACVHSSATDTVHTLTLLRDLSEINARACDATGCWEEPSLAAPPASGSLFWVPLLAVAGLAAALAVRRSSASEILDDKAR